VSFISGLITGQNAIRAQQLGAQVAGNNISNAAVEGYVRQRVSYTDASPYDLGSGLLVGTGVEIDSLDRIIDQFLETRIRSAIGDTERARINETNYSRLETVFNELTENDLSTALNQFFNDLEEIQNNPESISVRTAVISSGQALADIVTGIRETIDELRALVDGGMNDGVAMVNEAITEIGKLNQQILELEDGGLNIDAASQLRDRRDLMIREISSYMDIRVDEVESTLVNITSQGSPLVLGTRTFELTTTDTTLDRSVRVTELHYSDGRTFVPNSGAFRGIIDSRDTILGDAIDELDQLAGALVNEFNKIYSQGVGLTRQVSVTSFEAVSDPLAVINNAGLNFAPDNGYFDLRITQEASGTVSTFSIDVDLDGFGADSTLTTIAADINGQLTFAGFTGVAAVITADNRLEITSNTESVTVSFGTDTSGFLAAMGINTFFTGSDSSDISVSDLVKNNPNLFAAGRSNLPGDNTNAVELTNLGNASITSLGDRGYDDFFEASLGRIAINAREAGDIFESNNLFRGSLEAERETISGVSIDEEVLNLLAFQRAFEGAARFISTINGLIDTLLAM